MPHRLTRGPTLTPIAQTSDRARLSFLVSMLESDGIDVTVHEQPRMAGYSGAIINTYELFVEERDVITARRLIETLDKTPAGEIESEPFDDEASFSEVPEPPALTWRNYAAGAFGLVLCAAVFGLWWLRR